MQSTTIKFVLSLLFCFTFTFIGHTQISERIKNRAENRANRRADQKIDETVDKTLDKIEGLFRKKKDDQPESQRSTSEHKDYEENNRGDDEMTDEEIQSSILGNLNLSSQFEPYENPLRMSLRMDIKTENHRGKKDEMSMHYTLDTWATAIVINSEDNYAKILLDNKDGWQTIISENDGERQAIKMRQYKVGFNESFIPDESSFEISETGKTRTIDGYSCKEYLIKHEEGITNSWITEDIELDRTDFVKALSAQIKGQKKTPGQQFFNMNGFPIESVTVSKNGKETTTIHYTDIKMGNDIDLDVFDLGGIEVISVGF